MTRSWAQGNGAEMFLLEEDEAKGLKSRDVTVSHGDGRCPQGTRAFKELSEEIWLMNPQGMSVFSWEMG